MTLKYGLEIDETAIDNSFKRITNQVYKLLPNREENIDWEKPLETVIVELAGMSRMLIGQHNTLFPLICKLEGLFTLTEEADFLLFRRTIFECLSMIGSLKKTWQD